MDNVTKVTKLQLVKAPPVPVTSKGERPSALFGLKRFIKSVAAGRGPELGADTEQMMAIAEQHSSSPEQLKLALAYLGNLHRAAQSCCEGGLSLAKYALGDELIHWEKSEDSVDLETSAAWRAVEFGEQNCTAAAVAEYRLVRRLAARAVKQGMADGLNRRLVRALTATFLYCFR